MDLHEEAVRSLRGYSPHRSCEAREVGLISISEDPRLVRAMPIPATECSSKAAANAPETRRKFTKDVKSNGTNRRSPLESTKVPKKQTQKACKRGRKMCQEYAKKLKRSERATPKGQILAAGLNWLRKNPFGVSFRGAAGDEESRIVLKTLRARFLAPLGMTAWKGFSAPCEALPFRFRSQTLFVRHVLTHQEYTDPWIFSSRPFSPHSGHNQLHIPNILWNFWQLETEYLMKALDDGRSH